MDNDDDDDNMETDQDIDDYDYENITEDVDNFDYLYSLFLVLLGPIGVAGGYMIKRKKLSFRHMLTLFTKIKKVKSVKKDNKKKVSKNVNYKRRGTMESIIDETIEVINNKTIEDGRSNKKKRYLKTHHHHHQFLQGIGLMYKLMYTEKQNHHHQRLICSQKRALMNTK